MKLGYFDFSLFTLRSSLAKHFSLLTFHLRSIFHSSLYSSFSKYLAIDSFCSGESGGSTCSRAWCRTLIAFALVCCCPILTPLLQGVEGSNARLKFPSLIYLFSFFLFHKYYQIFHQIMMIFLKKIYNYLHEFLLYTS